MAWNVLVLVCSGASERHKFEFYYHYCPNAHAQQYVCQQYLLACLEPLRSPILMSPCLELLRTLKDPVPCCVGNLGWHVATIHE